MDYLEFINNAHEYQIGKVCSKCNTSKPLEEYFSRGGGRQGVRASCKACICLYARGICPFRRWWNSKKHNAKTFSVSFTIKPADIPGVTIEHWVNNTGKKTWSAIEYPKVCPVLDIDLDWGMNGRKPNSPSLDRIDSTKGYIKGNVMLMSSLANSMKQNATIEQLKQFGRYWVFGNIK